MTIGLTIALVLTTAMTDIRAEETDEPKSLEVMTITANKSERSVDELPGTVSVITEQQIREQAVQNIDDLVRYEPGVSVADQGSRFGRDGFSIRGIGGNRVLTEVDGVAISDSFSIGSFSNASRDLVEVDTLKQVEIIRGTASSLFGSDALGGVVSFVTRDPEDYLSASNRNWFIGQSLVHDSRDDGLSGTTSLAARWGEHGWMLSATRRDAETLDINGAVNRNPTESESEALLAKWVWQPGDHRIRLTADTRHSDAQTDVNSLLGTQDFTAAFGFPYLITTQKVQADDATERERYSLEDDWLISESSWLDRVQWRLYTQQSETRQDTHEERVTVIFGEPDPVIRDRRFVFEQQLDGAELTLSRSFTTGPWSHRLIAGLEYEATRTEQIRTGQSFSVINGTTSSVVGPDTYPVRDFPITDTTEFGFYLQDELSGSNGRWTLVPGIRFDDIDLNPRPDAIFIEDNPGVDTRAISQSEWSPRLGMVFQATESLGFYGQYSRGFRAPPYNDVNVGFTNFQFGYTALPNPDLKPETADLYELGLRWSSRNLSVSLNGYYNQYEDFIESFVSQDVNDQGLLVFQSRNLNSATIYGAEFRLSQRLDQWLDGLSLQGSGFWTRGNNDLTDQPLNSVEPAQLVVGLRYDAPSSRFGAELIHTSTRAKTRVDERDGELFTPPGHGLLDLYSWVQVTDQLRLNAAVRNLTDKTYWRWNSVNGLGADSPSLDRFASPGLNATLSLTYQF